MSFLPPASQLRPAELPAADVPEAAVPNAYLTDVPAVLIIAPPANPKRTAGDATMDRAQQRFDAGRRFYQSKDASSARREFDAAIDLMIQASSEEPGNRAEYDHRFEDMVESIHRYDLSGMGASAAVEDGKFEKAPLEDILTMTFPLDPKLSGKVREQVKSTTSQLPLSVTDPVLSFINYFATRGHRTLVAGYQRSGKYRAMIQRVFDEEGVPQELIHLAQAESGFIPRAVSRAAAGGMWQFLKSRGQQYGLMQTLYTDDRMDPEKATRAAAHHLHDLYDEFGDWYLAIAAYNCGPVTVEKAVERTGYADFWELRSRGVLPAETTNYVPIILAMTIMEKNGAEYGLTGVQMEAALEYDTVRAPSLTNLNLVADITGAPLAELAALNPAALRTLVPEGYALHVPKGTGNEVSAALQLVPAERRASWRMHRVGPDDTFASIAKRYGVSPASLMTANNLTAPKAEDGDRLLIPSAARPEAPVRHTVQTAAHSSSSGKRTTAGKSQAHAKPQTKASSASAAPTATPTRKHAVILASAASK